MKHALCSLPKCGSIPSLYGMYALFSKVIMVHFAMITVSKFNISIWNFTFWMIRCFWHEQASFVIFRKRVFPFFDSLNLVPKIQCLVIGMRRSTESRDTNVKPDCIEIIVHTLAEHRRECCGIHQFCQGTTTKCRGNSHGCINNFVSSSAIRTTYSTNRRVGVMLYLPSSL